ncbi:MAG: hypothetical protein RI885_354, partial [Actinomycetota bacterium]
MRRSIDSEDPLTTIARKMLVTPAAREVVPLLPGESFRWMEHDYPSQIARWNYHPEIEIHLIRRSTGSYIIGDQIGPFAPGHVAIVGSGVPHDWMSDLAVDEVIEGRDAVIQFTEGWLERCAQSIPELADTTALIEASKRGIVFGGATARAAAQEIEAVGVSLGSGRIAHMFALLAVLSDAPESDTHFVTAGVYSSDMGREGKAAVDAGLAYILENLTGKIRMSEAARMALMSEPSFSKYFKRASGMTFSDMVKRLRIANACRLLDRTDSSISAISAAVGYTNLANFNRQFLAETGVTPRAYRALDDIHKP